MALLKVSIDERGLVVAEKAKDKINFGKVKTSDCQYKEKVSDIEIF